MNKKYIDQEEWIERLEEELSTCKNEKRKEYLRIWINAIKCQPTLDEKEIIRKPFERIVERLEQQKKQYNRRSLECEKNGNRFGSEKMYSKACSYNHAIEIVKEEGGIE